MSAAKAKGRPVVIKRSALVGLCLGAPADAGTPDSVTIEGVPDDVSEPQVLHRGRASSWLLLERMEARQAVAWDEIRRPDAGEPSAVRHVAVQRVAVEA